MEANLLLINFACLALSLFFIQSSHGAVVTRIIRTKLGQVEGIRKEARYNKYYYAYYGIPYAKPPVGKLRFEPPVEAEPWPGVLNATQVPPSCPHLTNLSDASTYTGEENCIFLHVYTPETAKPGANIPVIFYIYGGQLKYHQPTDYGPEFLMSRDIVLVTASYRYGMLGFLSTGDVVIPGNMGLKDQLLAMKWTRKNIYDYGGDSNKITLHGHSAGSVCVHMHTLSPQSTDYFDQVIMQSGFATPVNVWDQDFAKGVSRSLAIALNCPRHSSEGLKRCLQNVTARELVLATEKIYILADNPYYIRPVIEDARVENAFLDVDPSLFRYPTESKPWLVGITSGEGAGFIDGVFSPSSRIFSFDPKLLLSLFRMSIGWSSKPNHINFIVQFLKTRYFGEEGISETNCDVDLEIVKMLTEVEYSKVLIDVVQKYAGLKFVYLFVYRYSGGYTHSAGGRDGRYVGVAHGDELAIIFCQNKSGIAEEDFKFGDEMITRWTNFVYSGNPNEPFPINASVFGAWSAVTSPRMEFLRINRNGGMEHDYFLREFGFLRRIPFFSKYSND